MKTAIVLTACGLLLGAVGAADVSAIDHTNLDEGRPVRVEDAYPIASGEVALEAGGGLTVQRGGGQRGVFPVELVYGALPNLQIGLGTLLSTDPHEIDDRPKSGDLRFSALYNFNQETLTLPALAIKLGVDAPTGIGARGVAVEVKAIVTRSVERLSMHLNAGVELLTAVGDDGRPARYTLALGASYPLGAPWFTRATLIGDVFAEQATRRGEATTVGTEVGLRYQLSPRLVWDVGLGTELAGPSHRSAFFTTTGLSFGF
jgi:outer membrane putative beta-barrel porin/alpha-amylase